MGEEALKAEESSLGGDSGGTGATMGAGVRAEIRGRRDPGHLGKPLTPEGPAPARVPVPSEAKEAEGVNRP